MASGEKFCLKWNDFESNISGAFRELRDERDFFDVTLACDDDQIQGHKVILSACSPFFRNILRRNPHQHPLLYLKGIRLRDMQQVMNFMYHGEANIAQDDLNNFLAVAEDLKIKGLTQGNSDSDRSKQSSVKDHQRSSYKKPVKSAPATAVSQSMDDDDIQEVETVPIKQELDTVKTPAAVYSQYQSNQQVATGAEFDDGQYYEEYDDTYTDDYSGAGQLVGDKGESRSL